MAILAGMIGTYPVGGVLWDYGQYAAGLERLGYEVFYLEDCGMEPYDPRTFRYGESCEYAMEYLPRALGAISGDLAQRWHFRSSTGEICGMPGSDFEEVARHADLFLNVSGSAILRDEYLRCRRKVLIDTDPGWNHFVNYPRADAGQLWPGAHSYREHDFFFTYAEQIGQPGCLLPGLGLEWKPTRPPAVLDLWKPEPPGDTWTTVMTWDNFRRPIEHEGAVYGTKELEFPKVETLPERLPLKFELATGGSTAPRERWRRLGWSVVEAEAISATPEDYRKYIQKSRGEFSVAKNVYVATHSGWFSCRTVCYLAAGRPAVVQDTGFSRRIPTGKGLMAFTTVEEAEEALRSVERDYEAHQDAAREVAGRYFSDRLVLGRILEQTGLGGGK